MELDKRIKENKMPLTCFHVNEAKTFIGNKGYFTSDISKFYLVEDCIYGTLDKIKEGIWVNEPYHNKENSGYYPFFLPEKYLKPKYIPFKTLNDLRDYKIRIGDVIQLRPFDAQDIQYATIVTNITFEHNTEELIDIALGPCTYSFASLCNQYLFLLDDEWVPFGKRVEE